MSSPATKGSTSRPTTFVIGAALAALFLASLFIYVSRCGDEAGSGRLPPMTMLYEAYGPSISVGDRSIEPFKELHRLEYRSETQWVDTVIESPAVDLGRYGTRSSVGSYTRLNGKSITEYDAMDGSIDESTVSDDTVFVPDPALALGTPDLLDHSSKFTKSRVTTSAKVCFNGECVENAVGILYESSRTALVFVDDSRGIPLRLGDGFLVRSVEIHDSKR